MTLLIDYIPYIVVFLGVVGSLLFVAAKAKQSPSDQAGNEVEYRSRKTLMTNSEVEVFRYLKRLVAGRAHICPMVRISDIISVHKITDAKARLLAFRSISQKHVDFVVIANNGRILFAIELDDPSHQQANRIKRDELVNMVFQKAGIKLLRGDKDALLKHAGLKKLFATPDENRDGEGGSNDNKFELSDPAPKQ